MATLAGRTLVVTGGSRGIGLAIAKRAAADGANIVIAAKTAAPHATLPGTIHTAAKECEEAGAPKALAIQCDIMDDAAIERMVAAAVGEFGGIDILINNASAIDNSGTLEPLDRMQRRRSARAALAAARPRVGAAESGPRLGAVRAPLIAPHTDPGCVGPSDCSCISQRFPRLLHCSPPRRRVPGPQWSISSSGGTSSREIYNFSVGF